MYSICFVSLLINSGTVYSQSEVIEEPLSLKTIDIAIGTNVFDQSVIFKLEYDKRGSKESWNPFIQYHYERVHSEILFKSDTMSNTFLYCRTEKYLVESYSDLTLGLSYYANKGFSSNSFIMNFGATYRIQHFGKEFNVFTAFAHANFGYRWFIYNALYVEGNVTALVGVSYRKEPLAYSSYHQDSDAYLSLKLGYQF